MDRMLAKFVLLVVARLVAACVCAPGFDELLDPARLEVEGLYGPDTGNR